MVATAFYLSTSLRQENVPSLRLAWERLKPYLKETNTDNPNLPAALCFLNTNKQHGFLSPSFLSSHPQEDAETYSMLALVLFSFSLKLIKSS